MNDVLTVGELTSHISLLLREDDLLADVTVTGEISNAVLAKSGHFYFSLKDADASISCVMWRSNVRTLFEIPREGESVIAHGRVDLYRPRGQLQLVVDAMRPAGGLGDLYKRFEEIKARLLAEGLFDAERKRPLPLFPRRIGVVTSATGAALRDILRVLAQRWPLADVLLAPSLVQGAQAPAALQATLRALYRRDDIDVIILARGGGSIEDLWAFNDEGVARLVAEAPVPVVSGVGHETDFTIVDFVADVRAPTPSAAAAAVSPDSDAIRQELMSLSARLTAAMLTRIERARMMVERDHSRLERLSPQYRLDQRRLMVDELDRRLALAMENMLDQRRVALDGLYQRLLALNPNAVVARGYAIVRDEAGHIVQSVQQVTPDQPLDVQVSDGHFPVVVLG
ncbi:MAG: exodeoxyribonuclease VII large subunit [Caldilineae bacterium]|nr:MAG: exodeoxyribonuclease VII large subunit [Caldilineae bacterium]